MPFPYDQKRADELLAFVRAGVFPLVAAQAAGISRRTFLRWLRRGSRAGARQPYAGFVSELRKTAAMARAMSEVAVAKKDPKFWLTRGPGKQRANYPGWTGEVKAPPVHPHTDAHWQSRAELAELCQRLMKALEGFPEARSAAARALGAVTDKRGVSRKQSRRRN
jgi:hypothetical protein